MASSSTKIESSESSGASLIMGRANHVRGRGMPNYCRCGERALIKTSGTAKNPGRLFHCCPKGSEKDNYHLFKWTDESLVEDVEDLKGSTETLQVDVKTCEAVIKSFEKEIEDLKKMIGGYEQVIKALKGEIQGCEKEIKEIGGEIRLMKTMMVCGVVVAASYCFIWA